MVRTWAQGNLVELYLLAPAMVGLAQHPPSWDALAAEQARPLLAGTPKGAFELSTTRRQVARYVDWYAMLGPRALPPAVLAAAQAVLDLLPADPAAGEWDYGDA